MVNINLLPWREKQARYERRMLMYAVLGAMACAMSILMCGDRYLASQQQALVERINNLKKELAWREGLANHIQSQNLFVLQENMLHFFRRLNASNAQEVCFEQIKKSKLGIEFMGFASSPEQLTVFLQTSMLTGYFTELKVNQLQQHNGQVKFNLLGKTHAV